MKKPSSKVLTPEATVIIWNYNHRLDSIRRSGGDVEDISEKLILTNSLTYIATNKTKSQPAGGFEFRLAPDFNWVARITPGSWCVILMANGNQPVDSDLPSMPGSLISTVRAQENTFKMLGRIHSVRADIVVDNNGARSTSYVVTGEDWAGVYNTNIYIDPIVRNNNLDTLTDLSQIMRMGMDKLLPDTASGNKTLPSTTQWVDAIMQLWGKPVPGIQAAFAAGALEGNKTGSANPVKPDDLPALGSGKQFTMPSQVANWVGLALPGAPGGCEMGKLIHSYFGRLTSYDTYADSNESFGKINPQMFFGTHTFWQLLNDVSNIAVNELIADMRWESSGLITSPKLALYKRIRPFITRPDFMDPIKDVPVAKANVDSVTSLFKNVRCHEIDMNDVLTINAGTNWRDKINFIEIRTLSQTEELNYNDQVKMKSQIYDTSAYLREGFRPMFETSYYSTITPDGTTMAPLGATDWKFAMREWYFNTHLMLNGSLMVVGQDTYIGVGDNIQIDASIFGTVPMNASMMYPTLPDETSRYLLAHVENISHTFAVDPNTGARTFNTVIHFVRGIFTDYEGVLLGNSALLVAAGYTSEALEENASAFGLSDSLNRTDVVRSPIDKF